MKGLEIYTLKDDTDLSIVYDFSIGKTFYVHLENKQESETEYQIVPLEFIFQKMPGEWEILNLGKFKENQMTLEQVKEQKLNVRFFIKDEVQE
jgi:hypothetical protein